MKELYIVAQNAFTVSAPDTLPAWLAIRPRFAEFAAPLSAQKPVLEVDVRTMPLPDYAGQCVYEPHDNGVGFITASASRLGDGSLVMEFRHVGEEQKPRLSMKMPPRLDKADIILTPDGDDNDSYFLSHALLIAFMISSCGNGTLVIHASAVVFNGKAYLFQGRSGTGKSTHARMWTTHIPGAELLNDDNPVIRFSADGMAVAYGSPWSGKTHCYRNISAPVGAFVRIVRDNNNALRVLSPLKAYASLTASMFYVPFFPEQLIEMRHKTIERLAGSVACCEMYCRPDADAALTCMRGLSIYSNN